MDAESAFQSWARTALQELKEDWTPPKPNKLTRRLRSNWLRGRLGSY